MSNATDRIGILTTSLRALAKSAPGGSWRVVHSSGYGNPSIANQDGPLCATGNSKRRSHQERIAFARYVAAISPATLLGILDILETLAAERDAVIEAIDKLEAAFAPGARHD